MKIITVIPLKRGVWKDNLTYFSAQDVSNGAIVAIPLRNKKVLGLVINSQEATLEKSNIKNMDFNLKKIIEVKARSIFSQEYLNSALETSEYFAGNKSSVITALLPAAFRENYDQILNLPPAPLLLEEGRGSELNIKAEKLVLQTSLEDRTAFYKILIRGSFAEKKSVFIVFPTEYDIKIFEEALCKGIEQFVFTFHSGLSAKKILKKYEEIAVLPHPALILATAPFLSIPRADIRTIIVEHESSGAYKTIAWPHIDLRFFTELFAAKINAKLILSDTILRYETISRVEADGLLPAHPMQFRINFEGEIDIANPKPADGQFKIFPEKSLEAIRAALQQKNNVFIFSLRKGLATMTICRDCQEMISCETCGAPLVLYSSHKGQKRMFVCNRCEKNINSETICKNCGSWNLSPLGVGTDTVNEEIEKNFPGSKIFKLDKESAKTGKGAEKIAKNFEESGGAILVGTEMAFFYLKNKVPLSVIASFDSLWTIPSFKIGEKIIQIILSVIGNTADKLILQTKNENDAAIEAVKLGNLLHFVREELADRKVLNYPPFKRFIKITFIGKKEETAQTRKYLAEVFQEYTPEIFSGFIAKQRNRYVTNTLIKLDPKKWSLPEISAGSFLEKKLLHKLLSLPANFEIFVDPEDLL